MFRWAGDVDADSCPETPRPWGFRFSTRDRVRSSGPVLEVTDDVHSAGESIPLVNLARQYGRYRVEIDRAIQTILDRSAFIGGEAVARFERAFASYCGTTHCVGVNSGTDALYLGLRALGVGPGDEVIVPALSFIATAEAVSLAGARPVFVDVDPDHLVMEADEVKAAITPKTRALIPVHLFGQLAPMDRLSTIAEHHGLIVVEDAAQAHGASDGSRRAGALGRIGCFSFYPGKNLGAYGDAGAVVTSDDDLAVRIRPLANHGRTGPYTHATEGVNSRLDGLQAAILEVKLRHLEAWTEARRDAAAVYHTLLDGIEQLSLPNARERPAHVFHQYVIRVAGRDALRAYLAHRGIQTAVHYPTPLPYLAAYAHLGYPEGRFPAAEQATHEVLSLPICPEITVAQQERVATEIRGFLEERA